MNKKKLRYAILKEIEKGNKSLTEDDFNAPEVTSAVFIEAIRHLNREGYIKGLAYGDDRPVLFEGTTYLTEKGETYLQENSFLAKGYKGLKEIRDWLKL